MHPNKAEYRVLGLEGLLLLALNHGGPDVA